MEQESDNHSPVNFKSYKTTVRAQGLGSERKEGRITSELIHLPEKKSNCFEMKLLHKKIQYEISVSRCNQEDQLLTQ